MMSAPERMPDSLATHKKEDARIKLYWRKNVSLILWMLAIWLLLSLGCSLLFADFLNQFRIGGYKLGFWFAQQGSILGFVILISIYSRLIDKIDREYHVEEDD
ncbi:MAG: DUF4212 domain-containing protein [Candidatus Eutrophobiaceae bacterium]